MTFTRSNTSYLIYFVICAIAYTAVSAVTAQVTPEQAKMAGAVPLSTVLLDKIDSLLKKVDADPAAKAEYIAAGKDAGARPENMTSLVETKYPKLAAIFKTSDLTPFEFMNASGSVFLTTMLSEMDTPVQDERAAANIKFYKANKERVTATMNRLEAIEKGSGNTSSSPSPSSSPET
jgi:hypothetical protein